MSPDLQHFLRTAESFPHSPGVYLMRDASGEPIYIGKAVDLRSRVRSYFSTGPTDRLQIPSMVQRLASMDWIATHTEAEALILEANLIRKHKPKFNIDLKDDKHYPYLKLTVRDPFPRLLVTRRVEDDGAKYFGPYTDVPAMRRTMGLAMHAFKIRSCSKKLPLPHPARPCINFSIGRCSGACAGLIDEQEYGASVRLLIDFLNGRRTTLLDELTRRMEAAAGARNYELAAGLRDQISGIRGASGKQVVDLRIPDANCDVFGIHDSGTRLCLAVLNFREGVLIGKRHFLFKREVWSLGEEQRDSLVVQYYAASLLHLPDEVVLPTEAGFTAVLLESWFKEQSAHRVMVTIAHKGRKALLVGMAAKNAQLYLSQRAPADPDADVEELARALSLPHSPTVIEAFDISNLGGSFTVAGMVQFVNGSPNKAGYRRYKIKTVDGQDDFAMMLEVVGRRLRRLQAEAKPFPDLLLIDGGKGQLRAALKALEPFPHPPSIVSLAKQEELLFTPFAPEPVALPPTHPARKLAERIRNEVHRYAVTYHRLLRGKQFRRSALETIPGVGPARAARLLKRFGSLHGVKTARAEELAQVSGISLELANGIGAALRTDGTRPASQDLE